MKDTKKTCGFCALQTVDKKLFSPRGGRIALSANERIAEFLDFAIQVKFAYVNKLGAAEQAALFFGVFLFGRIEKRAKPPVYSRYAVIARKRLLMVV